MESPEGRCYKEDEEQEERTDERTHLPALGNPVRQLKISPGVIRVEL